MSLHRLLTAALLAGTLTGCLPAAAPTPVRPPTPTAGEAGVTPPAPSPTPGLPTPSAPAKCPVPSGSPVPPDLADPATTAHAILVFLNSGGAPSALPGLLRAASRAGGLADPTVMLDVNRDNWLDVAVAVSDPILSQGPRRAPTALLVRAALQAGRRGSVFVFLCQGERYILGEPPLSDPDRVPILHGAADLTGDQADDLLLGWQTCGAHTCFEDFNILSAAGTQIQVHRLEPTADLPYPEVDLPPAGPVSITGTGIASVGAGPFRRQTRTWAWDAPSQSFVLAAEVLEPPRYRIHVLLDGEAAARRGEWTTALDLYHRAVLDDALLDWVDPAPERANLSGYSMYRVVVTYAQMGDQGDAQVAYGILQNQYLDGSVGRAYADLARAFWEAYTDGGDLARGCSAARAFAEAHKTEVLDPLYFGYANPAYTPEDVCSAAG
jgi:hypothetical protein